MKNSGSISRNLTKMTKLHQFFKIEIKLEFKKIGEPI